MAMRSHCVPILLWQILMLFGTLYGTAELLSHIRYAPSRYLKAKKSLVKDSAGLVVRPQSERNAFASGLLRPLVAALHSGSRYPKAAGKGHAQAGLDGRCPCDSHLC